MTKDNPSKPSWFKQKNYDNYKKLNSKELCTEIEIRRLQIEYLKGNIKINKFHKNGIEKPSKQQLKNYHDKFFKVTREDFYFNSDNYNKSSGDPDYIYLSSMLSSNSNIILGNAAFFRDNLNPVDNMRMSDILKYFIVSRDVSDIYGRYTFHENPSILGGNDYVLFKEIARSRKGIDSYNVDIINKDNHYENPLDDHGLYVLPSNDHSRSKISADEEMERVRDLFNSTNTNYDYIGRQSENNLFLKIDIRAPDEIILNKVLSHVQSKRKLLQTQNDNLLRIKSDDKKSGGYRMIKTLIEQKIIQYIDLLIWNIENNNKPIDDWYMEALFEEEKKLGITISHSRMNGTIKKTAKQWLDNSWLTSFFHLELPSYKEIKGIN